MGFIIFQINFEYLKINPLILFLDQVFVLFKQGLFYFDCFHLSNLFLKLKIAQQEIYSKRRQFPFLTKIWKRNKILEFF